MTIVKITRPLYAKNDEGVIQTNLGGPYRVEDQLNARSCLLFTIPDHIKAEMDGRKQPWRRYRAYFDNAVWNREEQEWDLSEAHVIQDRAKW